MQHEGGKSTVGSEEKVPKGTSVGETWDLPTEIKRFVSYVYCVNKKLVLLPGQLWITNI